MLTKEQAVKVGCPPQLKDRYVIRCINQEFAPSKKGKPMITLKWEVVGYQEPDGSITENVERNGQTYTISGMQLTSYHVIEPGGALSMFFEFQGKMGLNSESVDETNPTMEYVGIAAHAILSSEESMQRKAATEEQKAAGKLGDPILDENGEKIIHHRPKIDMFLGRANSPEIQEWCANNPF